MNQYRGIRDLEFEVGLQMIAQRVGFINVAVGRQLQMEINVPL